MTRHFCDPSIQLCYGAVRSGEDDTAAILVSGPCDHVAPSLATAGTSGRLSARRVCHRGVVAQGRTEPGAARANHRPGNRSALSIVSLSRMCRSLTVESMRASHPWNYAICRERRDAGLAAMITICAMGAELQLLQDSGAAGFPDSPTMHHLSRVGWNELVTAEEPLRSASRRREQRVGAPWRSRRVLVVTLDRRRADPVPVRVPDAGSRVARFSSR